MSAWPGSLPQSNQLRGFQEVPPKTALRTSMDVGPAKMRQRFTANVRDIKLIFILTKAQVEILDDFFTSTLSGGALIFTWVHPRTNAAINVRFKGPPTYTILSGDDVWQATMEWEIMP